MNENEKRERNRKTARKFYELIADKQYDKLFDLCSKDFVYWPQIHTRLEGLQAFIDHERANMDPFGDFKMEVRFLAADGDRVAVYLVFGGTLQQDTWHGVPAPKKELKIGFMTWLTFDEDGKIIEKRAKYDRYDMYKQLSVELLPLK